jgi:hypothetical protein
MAWSAQLVCVIVVPFTGAWRCCHTWYEHRYVKKLTLVAREMSTSVACSACASCSRWS